MGFGDIETLLRLNFLSLPKQDAEDILASETGRFEIYVDQFITEHIKSRGFDYCCEIIKSALFFPWEGLDYDGDGGPCTIYDLTMLVLFARFCTPDWFKSFRATMQLLVVAYSST